MKRFTVVTSLFSVSFLVVWVIFQASIIATPKTNNDNTPIETQATRDELMNTIDSNDERAVLVTGAEVRMIAPVFDATGAVVSDPTGTLLGKVYSADVKIAPVFDATGALISDPTGTLLGAVHSEDIKIAPVFDAAGKVVSDPTGTIWSANNP